MKLLLREKNYIICVKRTYRIQMQLQRSQILLRADSWNLHYSVMNNIINIMLNCFLEGIKVRTLKNNKKLGIFTLRKERQYIHY